MAVEISKLDMARLHPAVPQPESEGILRPITANDTGRYERTGFAEPVSMQIASAQFTGTRLPEPAYLPEQWSALTHPEGQLYFCRFGSPVVVTEAYLYRKDILDKVLQWVKKIEAIAAQSNFPLSDRIELFIKLEEDDCAYYFVDHTTRAQTWMENSDTDELGLPPVVSVQQLGLLCEELYWSHVEHFPMHIGGLPREVLDSLICVFTHAICDQMTSRVSTFPYSKQECEGFVSLLRNSRDHLTDGHITCTVARLWSLICRNRYLTQYGEEFARLSRDQSVLYDPETKNKWVSTVASRLSFGTSDKYLAQLDDVFVDHLVYSEQWKLLMTRCLREWRGETSGAFFGLMLHIFFLSQPSCSSLAVTSASLFGASMLGSTFLMHRYAPLEGITAAQAMDYLESIQSPSLGFQCVALTFALPHALNLWGTLAIFANAIYMLATFFGTMSAAAISAIALLAFVVFQWTTSETFNISLAGFRAKFNIPFLRNNVDDVSYTSVV